MSSDWATSACKQGRACLQLHVCKFTCPARANLSTHELQTSVEILTQMAGCLLNVLVCEFLILSQLFDVEMSFIHKLIYYIGCKILDFYIVCNSFYIYNI